MREAENRPETWITIGRITAAEGIRGEVRVFPLSDSPGRFAALRTCHLRHVDGSVEPCEVVCTREKPGGLYALKLAGVNDRNAAEKLRNCELVVAKTDVGPLPAGHYYVFDIIGLTAVTPTGEVLGVVQDVIANPANDIYVIKRPGRSDILIPAVRQVVVQIDVPAGKMVVAPWPGMADDDAVVDT